MSTLYNDIIVSSCFVIKREKDDTHTSDTISVRSPKPSTLPPYTLSPIPGMGTPVITLTFRPSSQVNKSS